MSTVSGFLGFRFLLFSCSRGYGEAVEQGKRWSGGDERAWSQGFPATIYASTGAYKSTVIFETLKDKFLSLGIDEQCG